MSQSPQPPESSQKKRKPLIIPDDHCITDINWANVSYLWTIKQFQKFHCQVNKNLESPAFSSATRPQYKWSLSWKMPTSEFDGYFKLLVTLDKDTAPDNVFVKVKFALLDDEQNEVFVREFSAVSKNKLISCDEKFIEKKTLLDSNSSNKLLVEDTLRVFCKIIFAPVKSCTADSMKWRGVKSEISKNSLSENLQRFLYNPDFVDVKFCVGGRKLGAHKSILAARSPVFAAMFKHNMKENLLNKVKISDVQFEVFGEFLKCLYTGKTSANTAMALELLIVAEKYQVDSIKLLCEDILLKEPKMRNPVYLLCLADKYGAERLKKRAVAHIKTHPDVMTTQLWKRAVLTNPHLFDDVNRVE